MVIKGQIMRDVGDGCVAIPAGEKRKGQGCRLCGCGIHLAITHKDHRTTAEHGMRCVQGCGVGLALGQGVTPNDDGKMQAKVLQDGTGGGFGFVGADAHRMATLCKHVEHFYDAGIKRCQGEGHLVKPNKVVINHFVQRREIGRVNGGQTFGNQNLRAVADKAAHLIRRQTAKVVMRQDRIYRSMNFRRGIDQRTVKIENDHVSHALHPATP